MEEKIWTKQQNDAINAAGTVIVSAAAGSGKTAVLVERIIKKITDETSPYAADKLVVVTFTVAAAGEIRARVQHALSQLIAADPKNRFLLRQQQLLSRSHIGTIDSFCIKLVREFFYLLEISPNISVADESELKDLSDNAVYEAMNEFYKNDKSGDFDALSKLISGGRSDEGLKNMVVKLYENSVCHPFGKQWLHEKMSTDFLLETDDESSYGGYLWNEARDCLGFCISRLEDLLELALQYEDIDAAYHDGIKTAEIRCKNLCEFMNNCSWDEMRAEVYASPIIDRIGRMKPKCDENVKYIASQIKDEFNELKKNIEKFLYETFSISEKEAREDGKYLEKNSRMLFDLVVRYWEIFDGYKKEREIVGFSDVLDLAVRLVAKKENGKYIPTDTARSISERFDEIMIDEFQDTNEAQDILFRCISKDEKNIFMVGDVKQSIYSFRQAMPEIFIKKRREFIPFDNLTYPAKITLDKNFRSKKAIIHGVNEIFSQIMSEKIGGTDYRESDSLVYGAPYGDDCGSIEIAMMAPNSDEDEIETQGRYIASKIHSILADEYVGHGENRRRVRPSDICIMMRSAGKYGDQMRRILKENDVSSVVQLGQNLFEAKEIGIIISFLSVVSNPLQDIPLVHLMMSELFGFSAEAIGRYRATGKKGFLYQSLISAQTDEDLNSFLEILDRYRMQAAVLTVSQIVENFINDFSYETYINSRSDAKTANTNLKIFLSMIDEWASMGIHTLSPFVRRIKTAITKGIAPRGASGYEGENVLISTIHRAKGLEYPICFLAAAEKKINTMDLRDSVLSDNALGIGMKRKSENSDGLFLTLPYMAIQIRKRNEIVSEEMRLLYVALTRAREKLYIIGSENKKAYGIQRKKALPFEMAKCISYLEMIKSAVGCSDYSGPCIEYVDGACESGEEMKVQGDTEWEIDSDADKIRENIQWRYPYLEQTLIKSKYSVTQLSKDENTNFSLTSVPIFAGRSGTSVGTAFHKLMQYMEPALMRDSPRQELKRLTDLGYLSQEEKELISDENAIAFSKSSILDIMISADKLYREYKFISALDSKTMWAVDESTTDTVMLQGVVDCICINGDTCVIIDYKTDRCRDTQYLVDKYSGQLGLYEIAIKDLMGLKVNSKIIYSVHLGKEIYL